MIFDQPGHKNTYNVFEQAKERAKAQEINTLVIASSSGETALAAIEYFGLSPKPDYGFEGPSGKASGIQNLVVVTHVTGFDTPDHQEMPAEMKSKLETAGARVVTAAHSLGGIGRAARIKFGTYGTDELIAHALRLFGEGTKVAVEIAMMAADAGAVSTQERLISIGGTSSGADTALILQPANTHRFFDLRIDEIICKPAVSKARLNLNKKSVNEEAGQ